MKRMFSNMILAGVLLYVSLLLLVFFMQDRLLYFPYREMAATPAIFHLPYQELRLQTRDGLAISAWWIPAAPEHGSLLFCHGNAGNISHRMDSIEIFHRMGLSVLIFDYRGFGQSQGKPSEQGTYLDAEASWDYLADVQKKSPQEILLFGESLGSAVAAELAGKHTPAGLILLAGFPSIPDLAARLYPFLPVRWLCKFRYKTIERVANLSCPKLFIHSRQDEIVPFDLAQLLYTKAANPKTFLEIQGGHNDGFLRSREIAIRGLKEFLDPLLNNQASSNF